MSENEGKNVDSTRESKKMIKVKKPKVKAWCGECFQFFENGPFAKACKEHITKGKCNLVECKKRLFHPNGIDCVRKFPNTNSENRHTYCLSEIEIKHWEEQCKIQNCLGVKRNSDINYNLNKFNSSASVNISLEQSGKDQNVESNLVIKNPKIRKTLRYEEDKDEEEEEGNLNNEKNQNANGGKLKFSISCLDPPEKNKTTMKDDLTLTVDLNLENLVPNCNYKNYEFSNLIDEINNLNFWEGEKFSIDDKLIDEFNNIYFNTPDKVRQESKSIQTDCRDGQEKSKQNEKEQISKFKDTKEADKKIDKKIEKKITEIKEISINELPNEKEIEIFLNDKKEDIKSIIPDDECIDNIFDRIHAETKIPKSILNKLKNGFKKRGIFNAKILRLFRAKYKNLNFLVDDFKKTCTQIEGVALFLESVM
jgi:hypothetical protein